MNIIFITIDALRKDFLECYGNKKNICPTINRLSENAIIFDNAYTTTSCTSASISAMFSGCYPTKTKIRTHGDKVPKDIVWLIDEFKKAGYQTFAAAGCSLLSSRFKINRGFDHYISPSRLDRISNLPKLGNLGKILNQIIGLKEFKFWMNAKELNSLLFPVLDKNIKQKFFLWLHYFETHESGGNKEKYENRLKEVDDAISELQKFLVAKGHKDNIYVLLADHGQTLLMDERGYVGQVKTVYEELATIPVIVNGLGRETKHISGIVRSLDILPLIMHSLGIAVPFQVDALKETAEKTGGVKEAFFEVPPDLGSSRGIRTEKYKFIINSDTDEQLFYLKNDPHEKNNLISKEADLTGYFRAKVKKHFSIPFLAKEKDAYTKNILKELGYLND